jgi:hypothetical protein
MLLSHHQNARKNHGMKIGNRSFENVAQFSYLRVTVTNQNLIQEEIKREFVRDSRSRCLFPHLRTEANPVSEALCSLVVRILDDERSPETQQF